MSWTVFKNLRCNNLEEHDSHEFGTQEEVRCSGITDCGGWAHKPHDVMIDVVAHCSGVCKCNPSRPAHSPGDHK